MGAARGGSRWPRLLIAGIVGEIQFTRCPGCGTVYRVTAEQLALREGQVRCGRCRAVFDATMHPVEIDPLVVGAIKAANPWPSGTLPEASLPPEPEPHEAVGDKATGDAAQGTEPSPVREDASPEREDASPEREDASPGREDASPDLAELEAARAALRPRGTRARSGNVFYAIAALVLLVALGVQAIALFGVDLVARMPSSGAAVAALCRWVDCRIGPRRDAASLSIEGSDLRPDPARRGLLVLTATLRNRATRPIAWPDIELTLTDSADQAVARRVLTPADYLPPGTGGRGFDAHSEREIRVFLDATAARQAGYRLYLFYP